MNGEHKPFSPDNELEVQRLEMALDAAGVGTWELDLSTNMVRWCKRTKALFGFSGEDILPYEIVLSLIHPDDKERIETAVAQALDSTVRRPYNEEFRVIVNGDKETRWLLCNGLAFFDTENQPARFLGTAQNISENVANRLQIRESEIQLRNLVNNSPDIILRWNRDLEISFANKVLSEKTGIPDITTKGKTFSEIGQSAEVTNSYIQTLTSVFDSGKPQDLYHTLATRWGELTFNSRFVPEFDHDHNVTGVLAIARDVTEMKLGEARFQTLIEQSPMAIGLLRGKDLIVEIGNDKIFEFWSKDKSVVGRPILEILPEIEGQGFMELLRNVYNSGKPFFGNGVLANISVNGQLEDKYFDFVYTPMREKSGEVSGVIVLATEVTDQILAKLAMEKSEARFRSLIEEAPVATCLLVGRDMVVEVANDTMLGFWGKNRTILGQKLGEAIPELKGQPFLKILDEVFTTGKAYESQSSPALLSHNGALKTFYFDFTYKPLKNDNGEVYAIMDMAVDVTEQVLASKALEESELFSRSVIENSPIAKLVLIGEDMVIRTVNDEMLKMTGKDISMRGKTLLEAIPEMEGTPIKERLLRVLHTGESFHEPEEKLDLIKSGIPYSGYYNQIYKALTNTDGERYGVIVTAIEVTEEVLARQKIEEAENSLRDAVELAELGTWLLDPGSLVVTYSERLKNWFGLEKRYTPLTEVLNVIEEKDRDRVEISIKNSLSDPSNGNYSEEFIVTNPTTGQRRILQARGRAFFNNEGEAYLMRGTAQDVTEQRLIQISLEQQVQERTEELETSNEELAAINEEYAATNEELAESNFLLMQSNQNLQQFAYIASHDLQEPLRKIQSFGNLLSNRYSSELGEGINLIERMQTAANRMSVLIHDLLTFSRISSRQDNTEMVDLATIIRDVLSDLELTVQETGAQITVSELPVINGDASQLGQLFQNLISNALKFKNQEVSPVIQITSRIISADLLPSGVKPSKPSQKYYSIAVSDNGIGFDQKYADRIFQVFQRLHGRSEFAGTGIGLAICEKVASNHGGAISAVSQPGHGATFTVFFPI